MPRNSAQRGNFLIFELFIKQLLGYQKIIWTSFLFQFTWEYTTKSKKAQKVGPISPLGFYNDYVRPYFNVANKICLVTDPRPNHPIGQTYTVDCLGNVVGAKPIQYNNQSVETLMELASKSIKAHCLIWLNIFQWKLLLS